MLGGLWSHFCGSAGWSSGGFWTITTRSLHLPGSISRLELRKSEWKFCSLRGTKFQPGLMEALRQRRVHTLFPTRPTYICCCPYCDMLVSEIHLFKPGLLFHVILLDVRNLFSSSEVPLLHFSTDLILLSPALMSVASVSTVSLFRSSFQFAFANSFMMQSWIVG